MKNHWRERIRLAAQRLFGTQPQSRPIDFRAAKERRARRRRTSKGAFGRVRLAVDPRPTSGGRNWLWKFRRYLWQMAEQGQSIPDKALEMAS